MKIKHTLIVLAALSAIALCIMVSAEVAPEASGDDEVQFTLGGINYEGSSTGAKVMPLVAPQTYSGNVSIPEKVNYNSLEYVVNSLDPLAFKDCRLLTSVIMPDGIKVIGDESFSVCSQLVSVIMPGVTSIGDRAFTHCTNLRTVSMPNIGSIGEEAFNHCISFESLDVTLASIGDHAFSNCYSLRDVNLKGTLSSTGNNIFYECASLESISLPESVVSIGNDFLYRCSSLTQIKIPSTVTSIGEGAFSRCSALSYIDYAGANSYSFGNGSLDTMCPIGTKIKGPSTIPSNARGSTTVTIVTENSPGHNIQYTAADYQVSMVDGEMTVKYNGDTLTDGFRKYNGKDIGSIIKSIKLDAPNVKTVSSLAFNNCHALKSVELPVEITKINPGELNEGPFHNCYALKSITIPVGVTVIDDYAFTRCLTMESVVMHSGITKIGDRAFGECYLLKQITIPAEVKSIGKFAFYECQSLASVTIPDTVEYIGESAFSSCRSLTNVKLPANMATISTQMFNCCFSLSSIEIPETVQSIGGSAFMWTNLMTLKIPDEVSSIGSSAFHYCNSLSYVSMPDSVTVIGNNAFLSPYLGNITVRATSSPTNNGVIEKYLSSGKWLNMVRTHLGNNVQVLCYVSIEGSFSVESDAVNFFNSTINNSVPKDGSAASVGDVLWKRINGQWVRNITVVPFMVTFNPNHDNMPPVLKIPTKEDGMLPYMPTVLNAGHTFMGWYDSPSSGTEVTVGTIFTSDSTIYAHWQAVGYTLRLNSNNTFNITTDKQLKFNESYVFSECGNAALGQKFVEWKATNGNRYPSGTAVSGLSAVQGDVVTVFAQWRVSDDLSYTVFGKCGSTTIYSYVVGNQLFGSTATVNAREESGYTLSGPNQQTVVLDAYDKTVTFEYTANYVPPAKYIVTLVPYASDGSTSFTATKGSSLLEGYTAPSKAGSRFLGYWTEPSGTGMLVITVAGGYASEVPGIVAGGKWIGHSGYTFYAKWSSGGAVSVKTITYHGNGGFFPSGYDTMSGDSTVRFDTLPSRDGYRFMGWAHDNSKATPDYTKDSPTVTVDADTDLYAVWSYDSGHTSGLIKLLENNMLLWLILIMVLLAFFFFFIILWKRRKEDEEEEGSEGKA